MDEKRLHRRAFLKSMAVAGLAATCPHLIGCGGEKEKVAGGTTVLRTMKGAARQDIGLAIARGSDDPKKLVRAAIDAVGGIERFVRKGDTVAVKPNIAWSRTPEQAANTNPLVVETVVEMCQDAGAKQVNVFDYPCNPVRRTYRLSGIEEAVKRAGGDIGYMDERKFEDVSIPEGRSIKSWKMYADAFDADVLINVPVLKHHSLARLTMGMKNLMGLLGGNRESIHPNLDQKLADINTVIKPHLTIMDAFRVLKAHGPNAGTPDDVILARHLIVGTDPVAVDSYGATLFRDLTGQQLSGEDIGYIRIGHEMGLGEMDLARVEQQLIDVA
jgi:uncharacterized protein (DUF362 family)